MKALVALLLCLAAFSAHGQGRALSTAELEALLAPVALYPDEVVSHVLVAATYPEDVREAAEWLQANPQLAGEEAVRAAGPIAWHPSLKALLAYRELLERMAESLEWTEDLGDAYLAQPAQVLAAVQTLRQRAEAVQPGAPVIVYPVVQSSVVFLPFYDAHVVFGHWRHAHKPIFWKPWRFRHHVPHFRHHAHKPHHVHRPHHVHKPHHIPHHVHKQRANVHRKAPSLPHVHNHVHQARNARPIIQGARIAQPQHRSLSSHRGIAEHRGISHRARGAPMQRPGRHR